jgi:hypothetical protein
MGEVQNTGNEPATNITVTANFYDASDKFINLSRTSIDPFLSYFFPDPYVLAPQAKASFFPIMLYGTSGAQKVDHYNLTVSFSPSAALPTMLQITVNKVTENKNPLKPAHTDSLSINGTIKNIGASEAATHIAIYLTGYDSNGTQIGSNLDSNVGTLNPGEVRSFLTGIGNNYNLDPLAVKAFASYKITAQSWYFNTTLFRNVGQYTAVSDIIGVVPEFPSVLTAFLLLTAVTTVLVFYKKKKI